MSTPKLLCIDISGVVVQPEPMGPRFQAQVEGNSAIWESGKTEVEAIGHLIRRLALEHEGANWRRQQKKEKVK